MQGVEPRIGQRHLEIYRNIGHEVAGFGAAETT